MLTQKLYSIEKDSQPYSHIYEAIKLFNENKGKNN